MKDLQASVGKLMAAEHQLIESKQLLEIQDKELNALRSQVNILGEQPSETASASVQQERELRAELRKNRTPSGKGNCCPGPGKP